MPRARLLPGAALHFNAVCGAAAAVARPSTSYTAGAWRWLHAHSGSEPDMPFLFSSPCVQSVGIIMLDWLGGVWGRGTAGYVHVL